MKNLRSILMMMSLCSLQACTVQEFANDRKADPVASARARVAIAAEYIQKIGRASCRERVSSPV